MIAPLFVLSLFLLLFALWLRFSPGISAAPKPTRKPKHHNTPQYIYVSKQALRKKNQENLERWQQRARSQCLP